jgi:hypothetical protein
MMNEVETLKQVVKNLNEAVKELQAEVKALKGNPSLRQWEAGSIPPKNVRFAIYQHDLDKLKKETV